MTETLYPAMERLTPRQRAALYRVAKTRLRPWFADPKHMIRLREMVAADKYDEGGR